jgi:hypothetical protein
MPLLLAEARGNMDLAASSDGSGNTYCNENYLD